MPRLPDDPQSLMPSEPMRDLLRQAADARRAAQTDPLKLLTEVSFLKAQLEGYAQVLAWEALDLDYTWDQVAAAMGMGRTTAIRKVGTKKARR